MDRPKLLIAVTSPMSGLFFQGQLAWLRDQGFEVHFLCSPGQPAESIVASQDVKFHPVTMERGISPWRDLRALWRIVGVLWRVRPQIVNAGTPKAGMLVMLAACFCVIPVRIYTIHGLRFETVKGPLRWLLFVLDKFSCKMATHVVCVGPGLRLLALRHHLCPEKKLRVIGPGTANGIDLKTFSQSAISIASGAMLRKRLGILPDALVIGFVGRLVRDKGIAELTVAWRELRQQFPTAVLLLIGDHEAGDPIVESDRALLANDVRVLHMAFTSEIINCYAAMDLLVLPSYREGLPTVLLEAAAMELPVVATRIPGCGDVVEDEKTGLLVPLCDAHALTKAIARYLANPKLRAVHGQAARASVSEKFDRYIIWKSVGKFYHEVAMIGQNRKKYQ